MTKSPPHTIDENVTFFPADAANYSLEFLHMLDRLKQENGVIGVPTNLSRLDDALLPPIAGQYYVVMALSGHGKTALLNHLGRTWASVIANSNRGSKGLAIVATTETLVESLTFFHASHYLKFSVADLRRGRLSDKKRREIEMWLKSDRAGFPLFIIGASYARRHEVMRLTIERIGDQVHAIEEETGRKAELVCLDYLQNLAAPKNISVRNIDNKVAIVMENSQAVKRYAAYTACPWWVGVQAKSEVSLRDIPIPEQSDSQWASQIFQDADAIIGLDRPIKWKDTVKAPKYYKWIHEHTGINMAEMETDDQGRAQPKNRNLLLAKILKQREDKVGEIIGLRMDPAISALLDWEPTSILG